MTRLSMRPVYVVDGSAEVRAMASDVLQSLGYEAATFESCKLALDSMERRPPGALLVDLRMSPMAGDELCARMKESRALSDVPVVIFTSVDSPHEVMRSWRAGADDYLPTPVRRTQLRAKLEALARSGEEEEAEGGARLHQPGERRRLLFVDDSRFYRTVLGGALEHSGFQLLYAKNGPQALELAETHRGTLDAAIADLVMPGMDGLAFLESLRKKAGWGEKPVLAMSASEASPEQARAVEALTGSKLLEKRLLPVEAIVARVNVALAPRVVELRAAERVPFFSVVEFREAGGTDLLSGFSYDVSQGGIFVRSLTPLPAGTAVEMRVRLTMGVPVPLSLGRVVWANSYRRRTAFSYPVGMAVHFTHLEPDQEEEVRKLVKAGGRMGASQMEGDRAANAPAPP